MRYPRPLPALENTRPPRKRGLSPYTAIDRAKRVYPCRSRNGFRADVVEQRITRDKVTGQMAADIVCPHSARNPDLHYVVQWYLHLKLRIFRVWPL